MDEAQSQVLASVGPLLRGLLGTDAALPALRFEEGDGSGADRTFEPPPEAPPAAMLESLRAAIGNSRPASVGIPGAGTFREVAFDPAPAGRAARKVAFVTGAAQGFGREISEDLAREGAAVILADINEQGVREAADALCAAHGPGRATAVTMNVADGASVAAAVSAAVRAYGGFDVFIANAGVLRAESVYTQSERDFDFVTSVNYKGYYLCTQHAAPVLAAQNRARPGRWGDIIQINSKSGLAGSKRNFAYAGGKFGGIGLTQSFALELVEDGIKVNSVCPGNFFDGPLWSDPDRGLFVQYLRAGKVPGAETIQDVRRAYERKVPMGRGCTTPDVMKAIYYLIEQPYETGQAVPVTGGQVMLH